MQSKILGHANGWSGSILKYSELQEDTVIVVLKTENEINNILCNVRKMPVTLNQMKIKAETDDFMINNEKSSEVRRNK